MNRHLSGTSDKLLAEASPIDPVRGVGFPYGLPRRP